MKKLLFLLTVIFLALHSSFADWVIIQETNKIAVLSTIKIKGAKSRVDIGDLTSFIIDGTNIFQLLHSRKLIVKLDAGSLKVKTRARTSNLPEAELVATGKKERIGNHECEIYTWSIKDIIFCKMWIAKDFPGFRELNAAQDKIEEDMGNPMGELYPKASYFPGMAIRSEIKEGSNLSVSQIVYAKEEPVDDAVFSMPTGYQMKMPTAPAK
jgi:hypothetical protein